MIGSRQVWLAITASSFVWGCSHATPTAPSPSPTVTAASTTNPPYEIRKGGNPVRRLVKTGSDPDSGKINLTPQDTTIEDIAAEKQPAKIGERLAPFETTAWRVKCTLDSVVHEKDGDYYLVLKGQNGGKSVVEVPDPALCKDSRLLAQITSARKELEDRFHPTNTIKPLHEEAVVTGIGFLGWGGAARRKSATGYMGARLMPGIDFQFGNKAGSS